MRLRLHKQDVLVNEAVAPSPGDVVTWGIDDDGVGAIWATPSSGGGLRKYVADLGHDISDGPPQSSSSWNVQHDLNTLAPLVQFSVDLGEYPVGNEYRYTPGDPLAAYAVMGPNTIRVAALISSLLPTGQPAPGQFRVIVIG